MLKNGLDGEVDSWGEIGDGMEALLKRQYLSVKKRWTFQVEPLLLQEIVSNLVGLNIGYSKGFSENGSKYKYSYYLLSTLYIKLG